MPQKSQLPREILAKNLGALLKKTGMSAPEVASKAKVDRKTINNQLNARFDSRLDHVAAVAQVFGLSYLDLLNPHFDVNAEITQKLRILVDLYSDADDTGKHSILSVAQLAAAASKPAAAPEPGQDKPAPAAERKSRRG
jgi:transcriptional regulator with XRE-family HTH domain